MARSTSPAPVLKNGTLINSGQIKVSGTGNALDGETVTNTGGIEVLAGGALLIDPTTIDNTGGGTITVDSTGTLTLNGTTITAGTVTDNGEIDLTGTAVLKNGALGNTGQINVSGSGNALDHETVTNTGNVDVSGALLVDPVTTIDNTGGGSITVEGTGTLTLNGTNSISDGTLGNSGTLDATGTNGLHGIAITNALGATLESTGGVLTIDGSNTTFNNAGTLEANGGELDLNNDTVANSGMLEAVGGSLLVLSHTTVTNTATGTVEANDPAADVSSTVELRAATITGGTVATILDGVINATSGTNAIDGAIINNAGILESTGGTLTIDAASTISNTGIFEANGGNLIVDTALSGAAKIIGASLLELGASSAGAYSSVIVTFDPGSTGTLLLDHARSFGTIAGDGTVSGLDDDDTLDLRDIAFGSHTTVTYVGNTSGGTLSVFEGGVDVADIKLVGDYTGVHWALSDDGSPLDGTNLREVPGAISGLDASGNASEGSPIGVSITDAGHSVSAPTSGLEYEWQIFDTVNGWVDGTGTGVNNTNYTPGEGDEGHALRVVLKFTDAAGNQDQTTVSAGTVNGIADTPVVTIPNPITTTEDVATLLTGLSVSTTDGSTDDTDSFTATLYVEHGTLSLGSGSFSVTSSGTGTSADHLTITGSLADVNAALAVITYTPNSEFEGTDTVHFTTLSTEDVGISTSTAATETTATIIVNPVAEAGTASAPATLTLSENDTNVAIHDVSVGPLAEDSDDTVSTVLAVGHGTLHVGSLSGVTVTNNGTASVTVAGSAALVNTVLAGLTYTATTEYEGSDTLSVTVTSKDGSNTSSTHGTASTAITVNPVAEAGTASAPATLTLSENATNVAIHGISVGPLAEDGDDTVSTVLAVGHGTLLVSSLAGVTVTNSGTASVTVAGSAAAVNTVLAGLTYTATTEYEGSDTLNVTVTSTDGSNTSLTHGTASTAITVSPVADVPVVTASASPIVEDGTSVLTLAFTNAAGLFENADDSVTVTVTLNQGATLHGTGVTNNHNGTFTLTAHSASDLNGLTITPASEFNGTVTVGVSAVTHDGVAVSTAGTASTTLTVGPMVTVSAAATSVNEGGRVGLTISATFDDGDATNSVVITGVPTTATLSAGTNNGGGSWTLTPAQLAGLKLTAGDDDVSSITLQVTAKTIDDGTTAFSATQSVTITENPVAEAPSLAGTPTTVSLVKASGSANFTIKDALSESVAVDPDSSLGTITISNVPTGVTFNHGSAGAGNTWTLNPATDLTGLQIIYPNSNQHFTLSVVGTTNDGGNIATSAPTSIAVNIAPAGEAGQPINLALTGTSDGGQVDPITVTLTGVPTDWNLNGGTSLGDGTWAVHTSDPSLLTITPAASFAGAVQLGVTESWTLADGSVSSFSFSDNLEAYSAGSPIFALSGDDHLSGAGANDMFVFSQPIGIDIIYNFNSASDKIDLIGFNNVASFSDIQANLTDDANGNAVITLGAGETITLQGVHAAALNANDFVFDQTPVTTNASSITIGDGAILPLSGTINNTGTIALNSTGNETDLQLVEHGITLQGGGEVILSDSAENVISGTALDVTLTNVDNTISGAGQLGTGQLTLVNEGTIDATGANSLTIDTGVNVVTNTGTLEATGSGGLTVLSAIANSGILWANGAAITVQGEVSGNGTAMINGTGTLDFEASSTANVVFGPGAAGTLKLGDAFHFNGTISGFAGSDIIDLANVGSATASISYHENAAGTGGTLAISDGAQTIDLALLGHYSADNFSIVPDHAHGTLVTYVPHDLIV